MLVPANNAPAEYRQAMQLFLCSTMLKCASPNSACCVPVWQRCMCVVCRTAAAAHCTSQFCQHQMRDVMAPGHTAHFECRSAGSGVWCLWHCPDKPRLLWELLYASAVLDPKQSWTIACLLLHLA